MKQKVIALATALTSVRVMAGSTETNDWSFDVAPYLWVASIAVDTRLPDVPPSTPPSDPRFATRISAGAMFAAQARYRSVGLAVDFAWLRLDTEALNPGLAFSGVDLKSDFIHTSALLTYRLPLSGDFHADLLAGGRLWNVNEDLDFKSGLLPGFQVSGDKTWVDPIIGADLRYDLSARWSLVTKGTVGGFGVSADIAWEVFGGVNYRFTDWCSGILGYRYLHEDYNQEGFNFKLDTHGLLLGVGFQF